VFKKSLLFEIFGAHDDYNKFVVKSVKILFYKFLFPYCEVDFLSRHDGKAARGKYSLDPANLLNSFHKKVPDTVCFDRPRNVREVGKEASQNPS